MTPITAKYEVYYTIDILRFFLLAAMQTVTENGSRLQCFHITEGGTNPPRTVTIQAHSELQT